VRVTRNVRLRRNRIMDRFFIYSGVFIL